LAKRQFQLRMREDLKEKSSILSCVHQLVRWRSAEGESAKHKRASVNGKLLSALFAPFPHQVNELDLFDAPLGDPNDRQDGLDRRERRPLR
jgi:hypothetical protein